MSVQGNQGAGWDVSVDNAHAIIFEKQGVVSAPPA